MLRALVVVASDCVFAETVAPGAGGPPRQTVFAWGENLGGQTGTGQDERKYLLTAHPLAQWRDGPLWTEQVCAIACGDQFSALVTAAGSLHVVGLGMSGQMCSGDYVGRNRWTRVALPASAGGEALRVESVACGSAHIVFAAVLSAGREAPERSVWTCGRNNRGQLGRDNPSPAGNKLNLTSPGRVETQAGGAPHAFATSVLIAAGGDSTLVASGGRMWIGGIAGLGCESPSYFVTGTEKHHERGLLGMLRGHAQDHAGPRHGGEFAMRRLHEIDPQHLGAAPGAGAAPPTAHLALGTRHAIAVGADHKVRTWGEDVFGQCGHGGQSGHPPARIVYVPTLLEGPWGPGAAVAAVAAGQSHSVLLSAGDVWTWGLNCGSQEKMLDACSFYMEHRPRWSRRGDAGWTYGRRGPFSVSRRPTLVTRALDGLDVVAVAAGGEATILVTERGELYGLGSLYPDHRREGYEDSLYNGLPTDETISHTGDRHSSRPHPLLVPTLIPASFFHGRAVGHHFLSAAVKRLVLRLQKGPSSADPKGCVFGGMNMDLLTRILYYAARPSGAVWPWD